METDFMYVDFISFLAFSTRPFLVSLHFVYAVTPPGTQPQLFLTSLCLLTARMVTDCQL